MCSKIKTLRLRAEELRTLAEELKNEECKKQLLRCAEEYDDWANRLESLTAR